MKQTNAEECRICSKQFNKKNLLLLFTRKQKLKQIRELTGFNLVKTSGLPEHICTKCDREAEKAYAFRCRCIKSQAYFNNVFLKLAEDNKNNDKSSIKEKSPIDENPVCINIIKLVRKLPSRTRKLKNLTDKNNKEKKYEQNQLVDEDNKKEIKSEYKDYEVTDDENNELEDKDYEVDSDDDENDEDFTLSKKKPKKPKKMFRPDPDLYKNIICDQCGNTYNGRAKFDMHMRRHYGDKRFDCEICSAKYYTQAQLKSHMRIHTGERPFACKHCDRRFKDRSTCKKHERTHTNERPYTCTLCGKSFTTSYVLKNHMLIHTEERSFSCKMCNKYFKRKTHLKTHYRSLMHKQNAEKYDNSKVEISE